MKVLPAQGAKRQDLQFRNFFPEDSIRLIENCLLIILHFASLIPPSNNTMIAGI